jgi:hypothetical protein
MYIHFSLEEKKEVMWNFVNSHSNVPKSNLQPVEGKSKIREES